MRALQRLIQRRRETIPRVRSLRRQSLIQHHLELSIERDRARGREVRWSRRALLEYWAVRSRRLLSRILILVLLVRTLPRGGILLWNRVWIVLGIPVGLLRLTWLRIRPWRRTPLQHRPVRIILFLLLSLLLCRPILFVGYADSSRRQKKRVCCPKFAVSHF